MLISIGVESNLVYVRYKTHIEKEMYVIATAFISHENNDISKVGKSAHITSICCGELIEAQKHSHKNVYNDDSTFSNIF